MRYMEKFSIYRLVVILWMAFIFMLSSQPAPTSNLLSKEIAKIVILASDEIRGIHTDIEEPGQLGEINDQVLDYAHAGVYLVLAVLVINALGRKKAGACGGFVIALIICAVYAGTDEVHQMFVSGRGAQAQDFLLDCAGALLGLGMYFIGSCLLHNGTGQSCK